VDYIFERYKTLSHNWDSINNVETAGPHKYFRVNSLHADYRFYLPLPRFNHRGFYPYVNAFCKYGDRYNWFEAGYVSAFESMRGRFVNYGVSCGTLLGFGKLKRWGVDANLGAMYSQTDIREQRYVGQTATTSEISYPECRWKVNGRLNLYYYFFRNKTSGK
jgi:hypothetical protein